MPGLYLRSGLKELDLYAQVRHEICYLCDMSL